MDVVGKKLDRCFEAQDLVSVDCEWSFHVTACKERLQELALDRSVRHQSLVWLSTALEF